MDHKVRNRPWRGIRSFEKFNVRTNQTRGVDREVLDSGKWTTRQFKNRDSLKISFVGVENEADEGILYHSFRNSKVVNKVVFSPKKCHKTNLWGKHQIHRETTQKESPVDFEAWISKYTKVT